MDATLTQPSRHLMFKNVLQVTDASSTNLAGLQA